MTALDVVHLEVSRHAVERFLERGGGALSGRAEAEILHLAKNARPAAVPDKWRRDPREKAAEAWRSGDWILLVRRVPRQRRRTHVPIVITVFRADRQKRWW